MNDYKASDWLELIETDLQQEITEPLTGNPFFCTVMCKSHLEPHFNLIIPKKMHHLLPGGEVPLVITCNGKKWEMVYHGWLNPNKRLDKGWKRFAVDNKLELGDACLFELLLCSAQSLELKVQILKGGFPAKLLEKANRGESIDAAIIIDE